MNRKSHIRMPQTNPRHHEDGTDNTIEVKQSGPDVMKIEHIIKLKIKRNGWLFAGPYILKLKIKHNDWLFAGTYILKLKIRRNDWLFAGMYILKLKIKRNDWLFAGTYILKLKIKCNDWLNAGRCICNEASTPKWSDNKQQTNN